MLIGNEIDSKIFDQLSLTLANAFSKVSESERINGDDYLS
jgi:hypothetical protein